MSLFTVQKSDVLSACKNAIAYVNERRKKELEKAIDEEMRRFFFRPKSREVAKARLIADANSSDWPAAFNIAAWGVNNAANSLMEACRVVDGNTVQLDTEDAGFVNSWIGESVQNGKADGAGK